MLTVTESAKGLLREILNSNSDDPEMGLRLVLGPEKQMKMVLGEVEPGDQVVEYQGTKVLLVASELAPLFEEITLDVEDTADGPKLVVQKD